VFGAIGCGGSGGGGPGSGGNTTGSGGKSATGGATASGGASGSGGKAGTGGVPGTGGTTGTGGATASGGATGSGGSGTTSSGGASGSGGATGSGGGAGTGGATATGGGGTAGTGGAMGGGGATSAWKCPAASTLTGSPLPSGASPTRVATPPKDAFNMNTYNNCEGPVWVGDALYFSEMTNGTPIPPSRIFKLTSDDVMSLFIPPDTGSNGIAVDANGNLVTANHGIGGIVRFSLPDLTKTTIVSMYGGKRFNSPNDLTIKSDGTIYFTDPSYQNTMNPQQATHVYQVLPGSSTATIITDYTNNPNGITLSLDEQTLYVSGGSGVKSYPISGGAVAMTGTDFATPASADIKSVNTDGMVVDCAGNLYVVIVSSLKLAVWKGDGSAELGTITVSDPLPPGSLTNVAFGGADHRTLYITSQGNPGNEGVFKVHLNFPGMPY